MQELKEQPLLAASSSEKDVEHILAEAKGVGYLQEVLGAADPHASRRHAAVQLQLVHAAATGNSSTVQMLLSAGAAVDTKDCMGCTALMLAAAAGHAAVVEVLLQHGADVHMAGPKALTPLVLAALSEHVEVVKQLVAAGADTADAFYELMRIQDQDVVPAMEVLLSAGVPPSAALLASVVRGQTALHAAAAYDHVAGARVLLAAGAAVDVQDDHGLTPLHYAGVTGHGSRVVGMLLQAGASVEVRSNDGCLPLHVAVIQQRTAVVQALCKHMSSAQVDALAVPVGGGQPRSALYHAVAKQNTEIVGLLLAAGAEPMPPVSSMGNPAASWWAAPYGLAVKAANVEVIDSFIQHARPDALNPTWLVLGAATAGMFAAAAGQERPEQQRQIMLNLLQAASKRDPGVVATVLKPACGMSFDQLPDVAPAMITGLLSIIQAAEGSMVAREAAASACWSDVTAQRTAVQHLLVSLAAARKWPLGAAEAVCSSAAGRRRRRGVLRAAAIFVLGAGCGVLLQRLRGAKSRHVKM